MWYERKGLFLFPSVRQCRANSDIIIHLYSKLNIKQHILGAVKINFIIYNSFCNVPDVQHLPEESCRVLWSDTDSGDLWEGHQDTARRWSQVRERGRVPCASYGSKVFLYHSIPSWRRLVFCCCFLLAGVLFFNQVKERVHAILFWCISWN